MYLVPKVLAYAMLEKVVALQLRQNMHGHMIKTIYHGHLKVAYCFIVFPEI